MTIYNHLRIIMKHLIQASLITTATFIALPGFAQDPLFPPVQATPPATNSFPTPYGNIMQNPQATYPKWFPQKAQKPQAVTQPQTGQNNTQAEFKEFSGYLGIATDILPSSVAAQLPQGSTQGILIKEFAPDSPANVSELKPYDVLIAYGSTNIIHPEQFIKLVRNDSPGKEVQLKIVRQGQVMNIPITLGAQKTPDPKEFSGLAIIQAGKNKYQAKIRYIGPDGNKQVRVYKGTREEIFQQAMDAQDLPPADRQQLLFATRPRKNKSNSGFGSFFPFGGSNSGNDWMNPRKYFKW